MEDNTILDEMTKSFSNMGGLMEKFIELQRNSLTDEQKKQFDAELKKTNVSEQLKNINLSSEEIIKEVKSKINGG